MAGNFGFDSAVLSVAINATNQALTEMQNVQKVVYGVTDNMLLVNNSTSGGVLTQNFEEWNSHFKKAIDRLELLNTRVIEVGKSNTEADDETTIVSK